MTYYGSHHDAGPWISDPWAGIPTDIKEDTIRKAKEDGWTPRDLEEWRLRFRYGDLIRALDSGMQEDAEEAFRDCLIARAERGVN